MRQPTRNGILIAHISVETTADVLSIGCPVLILLSDGDRHNFTKCGLTRETKFGSIFSDTHKSQLPNPLKDSINTQLIESVSVQSYVYTCSLSHSKFKL